MELMEIGWTGSDFEKNIEEVGEQRDSVGSQH